MPRHRHDIADLEGALSADFDDTGNALVADPERAHHRQGHLLLDRPLIQIARRGRDGTHQSVSRVDDGGCVDFVEPQFAGANKVTVRMRNAPSVGDDLAFSVRRTGPTLLALGDKALSLRDNL